MTSLYEIPDGCICLGDGLMGMKCTAKEHARLKGPQRGERLPEPVTLLDKAVREWPYAPLLSLTERKAYQCVYRILRTYHIVPLSRGEVGEGREGKALAGPGARRSQLIDQLARVIVEEMGK